MKLCIPISSTFLSVRERLTPLVDAFELKNMSISPPPGRELVYHMNGLIEEEFPAGFLSGRIPEFLGKHGISYLSFDLGPSCLKYTIGSNGGFVASDTPLDPARIMDIASQRLDAIRSSFDGVLAVENLDYQPTGAYDHVCHPQFIREFITRFQVQLLLDLGHATISSHMLGYSVEGYLGQLPLDRVIEIHLSRSREESGIWRDAHELPQAEDHQLVDMVLQKARPQYITLEYYADADRLVRQYEELRRRVDNYNAAGSWLGVR